jgi:hypothetical protein
MEQLRRVLMERVTQELSGGEQNLKLAWFKQDRGREDLHRLGRF